MQGSDCLGCGSNCQMPCIMLKGMKEELKEVLEEDKGIKSDNRNR
jgi:hypothetical protein